MTIKALIYLSVLSGFLFTTALFNVSADVSIPLYWLPIVLAPLIFYYSRDISNMAWSPIILALAFISLSLLSYALKGYGEFVFEDRLYTDFKQVIARSFLLIYMFLLYVLIFYKDGIYINSTIKFTFGLIIFAIAYGYYQYFIYEYSIYDPLKFLRNSSSFHYYGGSGWLFAGRSHSLWAEPAFSMLPVLLAFYLSLKILSRKYMYVFQVFLFGYVLLTGSRLVWLAYILMLLLNIFGVILKSTHVYLSFNKRALILLSSLIVSVVWPIAAIYLWDDKSSLGRSSTVYSGLLAFINNLAGVGFNQFENIQSLYFPPFMDFVRQNNVHNYIVSFLYQLGLFGLIWVCLVYLYLFNKRHVSYAGFSFYFCAFFLLPFTNDQTYMSIFYLAIVLVIALESLELNHKNNTYASKALI